MATMKYFSGDTEVVQPYGMPNAEFAKAFPGVVGIRYDSFSRYVGIKVGGNWKTDIMPIERISLRLL